MGLKSGFSDRGHEEIDHFARQSMGEQKTRLGDSAHSFEKFGGTPESKLSIGIDVLTFICRYSFGSTLMRDAADGCGNGGVEALGPWGGK